MLEETGIVKDIGTATAVAAAATATAAAGVVVVVVVLLLLVVAPRLVALFGTLLSLVLVLV